MLEGGRQATKLAMSVTNQVSFVLYDDFSLKALPFADSVIEEADSADDGDDSARSWKYPRWVVARLEESERGSNPRFIISSRYDDGFKLYYEQYCAWGDMENRIKDQHLSLFADCTSSTYWWANQWRLILSGFAYTLFERLRTYLKSTPFARISPSTLRRKLIKVGAVIIRNTRRIRVLMSDSCPYKTELSDLIRRLVPS
tara:strand:+ start:17705 stop:18304 length:600 start_codon:yes stop_codon:yes gene_type:complete